MIFTFGVFPHDFWRWVTLHGAVENSGFAVDTILIVGLHHETRWHWRNKQKKKKM